MMANATGLSDFTFVPSPNVYGMTVYDPSGKEIGKIDLLMIDKLTGQVHYAVKSQISYDPGRDGATVDEAPRREGEDRQDRWMDPAWEARHRSDKDQA